MGSESEGLSSVSYSSPSSSWSPRTTNIIKKLKGIVDCTEFEIYDALVHCNMNSDEAVIKLVSQGKFQIVESRSRRNKKMKEIRKSISQAGYDGSSDRGINPSPGHLSMEDIGRMDQPTTTDLPSDTMPEMVVESHIKSLPDDQTATVVSDAGKDSKHSISDESELYESANSDFVVEGQESNHSDGNHSSDYVVVMTSRSIDDSERHGPDSDPRKGRGSVVFPEHLKVSAGHRTLIFGSIKPGETVFLTQLQSDRDASRYWQILADIGRMDRPTTTDLPSDTMPEMVDESHIKSLPDDQTASVVSDADKDSKHSISDQSGVCESTSSCNVEAQERNHSDRNHSSDDVVVMNSPSIDDSEGHSPDSDPREGRGSVVIPEHLKASAGLPTLICGSITPEKFASLTQLQSDRDASRTEDISSSRPFETRNIGLSADESLESLCNAREEVMTPANQNVVSSSVESHVSEYIRPSQHESNAMTSPSIDDSEGHGPDSDPRKGRGSVVFPEHLKASAGRPTLIFGSFTPEEFASLTQLQSDRDASRTEDSSSSRPLETRNIRLSADESLESLYKAHKEAMTPANQNVVSSPVESHVSEYGRPSQQQSNVQNIGRAAAQLSFARTNATLGNRSISNKPVYFEPQPRRNETSRFNSLRISDGRRPQLLANQPIPLGLGHTMSPFQVEWQAPPVALSRSSMSSYPWPNLPFEQPSYYSMNNQTRPYTWPVQSGAQLPSTSQQQQFHACHDNVLQSMPDLKSLPRYEGSIIRVPWDFGATGYVRHRVPGSVPGSYPYNSTSYMVSNSGYINFLPFHQQNSSSSIWGNNGSSSRGQPPSAGVIGDNRVRRQNEQYPGYRQDQERQSQIYQGSPPVVPYDER